MPEYLTSESFYRQFKDVFGLPDTCRKVVITADMGKIVTVDCKLVTRKSVEIVTVKYKLVPWPEPDDAASG